MVAGPEGDTDSDMDGVSTEAEEEAHQELLDCDG